jgi:shikimate dehydrogenase
MASSEIDSQKELKNHIQVVTNYKHDTLSFASKKLFHLDKKNKSRMKQFGLIGFPLGHSFSKKYFSAKFEKEEIDAEFHLFEIDSIAKFDILKQNVNLCGVSVTIPYKEQVIASLNELDQTAASIGAVNVIKFIRSNNKLVLKGYNSDVIGFKESIRPFIKTHHKKALILGTGGASKAIDFGLKEMGIDTLFVSRTPKAGMIPYHELTSERMAEYLVVVNASPVGTFPHSDECPDIPYEFLTTQHLLFDVVYNPAETLFLKKGKERGAATLNGEKMLIKQAEAAWQIWNS